MTNTQAQQLTPWQVYLTLSESADKASQMANKKIPFSSEWWEQIGLYKAYRAAAIMTLENVVIGC